MEEFLRVDMIAFILWQIEVENVQQQRERELQERDLNLQQMNVELQRTHGTLQQRTSKLLNVQKQLHHLQV